MHIRRIFVFLTFFFKFSTCRDFYLGMFKKDDLLVAQDILYKERVPFRFSFAKYGRKFHCPITYIRVEDRLNVGRGPRVQVIRGGLRRKILVLRLTSPYNHPISVNVYVGCENNGKFTNPPWTIIRPTKKTTAATMKTTETPTMNTTETAAMDTTAAPGIGAETKIANSSDAAVTTAVTVDTPAIPA